DTAMAVMLILLAATDLGVGALYFGIFYGENEALRELGVPGGHKPIGAVGLGHPATDETVDLTRFAKRRRVFDDMVHRNGW
ncbi:MAG: nitroreductase family protein, partial [Candidatus Dormibacterales bacterium]